MNRITHYIIPIIISVLCLSFLSCAIKKEIPAVTKEIYFTEPHILFLTCTVSADEDESVLKVEDKMLTKGNLKKAHMDQSNPKIGDWVVSIEDAASNILARTRLDNPLLYRAEYFNDDGVLETQLIESERGVLSVRMPIEGPAALVVLKRKTLNGFDSILQIRTSEL